VNGDQMDNSAPNAGAAYVFARFGTNWNQQAYLKASNAEGIYGSSAYGDFFGSSVSVSGDTVVVGALLEASIASGVNGDQSDNSARYAGAAYVFVRTGTTWIQQAYLKASNTGSGGYYGLFGRSVAIWGDTVVVGANQEASGVNGNPDDDSAPFAGAAYVFVRNGANWSQQAYLKAFNAESYDLFGYAVAVSGDTAVVGAYQENSSATGVDGDGTDNSATNSGAAYVFVRTGTNWTQQSYLKASNTDGGDYFGSAVAVFEDTVVVGAYREDSSATGVNGDQSDNSATDSGAAYVFTGFGPFRPRLSLVPDSAGGYVLHYTAAPAATYHLQRALSVTGPWNTIDTQRAPASGLIEYHDVNPPPGQAFYRTVQP
jgi:hypothetical protein